MLTSGTANGDSHITSVICFEGGKPGCQEFSNILVHLMHVFFGTKEFNDGEVESRQGAKSGLPVRIGKTAHIKNKIGIQWQPILVREGLKQ